MLVSKNMNFFKQTPTEIFLVGTEIGTNFKMDFQMCPLKFLISIKLCTY